MRNFIKFDDIDLTDMKQIFSIADEMPNNNIFIGKSIVLFFPHSSIRTRIIFEKGITLLGGQPILFPPDTLDKKENIKDVMGYLNNWADCVIVRHSSINFVNEMAKHSKIPIVNAMTNENHPCEVLSDLYSLSKLRENFLNLQYTFVGKKGNIGNTWHSASQVCGFKFRQCCPAGNDYEINGATVVNNLYEALSGSDIILTDSYHSEVLTDFLPYQVTLSAMRMANKDALLNPCPPFFRRL